MVKVGLIEPRTPPAEVNDNGPRLSEFLDEVITGRADAKPNTRESLKGARDRLIAYFGHEKSLQDSRSVSSTPILDNHGIVAACGECPFLRLRRMSST
jgi:hypothetical protein